MRGGRQLLVELRAVTQMRWTSAGAEWGKTGGCGWTERGLRGGMLYTQASEKLENL